MMKWAIFWNSSTHNMMNIFWVFTSRFFRLDLWLPLLKIYTISTVLFHKDRRSNVSVTNSVSHFSMFVLAKATVTLANENAGHAQGTGVIFFFP